MDSSVVDSNESKSTTLAHMCAYCDDPGSSMDLLYEVLSKWGSFHTSDSVSGQPARPVAQILGIGVVDTDTASLLDSRKKSLAETLHQVNRMISNVPKSIEEPDAVASHEESDVDFGEDYFVEAEPFDWDEARAFHAKILKVREWQRRRGNLT